MTPRWAVISFEKDKYYSIQLDTHELFFRIKSSENDSFITYSLRSKEIDFDVDDEMIAKLRNAIHALFLNRNIGLLMNERLAASTITEAGKDFFKKSFQTNKNVCSEKFGVHLINSNDVFIEMSANPTIGPKVENILNAINENLSRNLNLSENVIRAIELFNSTQYLDRINNSGRFVLLVSSIECLLEPKDNVEDIINIINEAQSKIMHLENVDGTTKVSTFGSLQFLKKQSIKLTGKSLIKELFVNDDIKFNGYSPVKFFDLVYDLRSKLVHEGKTSMKQIDVESTQVQYFTKQCIDRYVEKYGY